MILIEPNIPFSIEESTYKLSDIICYLFVFLTVILVLCLLLTFSLESVSQIKDNQGNFNLLSFLTMINTFLLFIFIFGLVVYYVNKNYFRIKRQIQMFLKIIVIYRLKELSYSNNNYIDSKLNQISNQIKLKSILTEKIFIELNKNVVDYQIGLLLDSIDNNINLIKIKNLSLIEGSNQQWLNQGNPHNDNENSNTNLHKKRLKQYNEGNQYIELNLIGNKQDSLLPLNRKNSLYKSNFFDYKYFNFKRIIKDKTLKFLILNNINSTPRFTNYLLNAIYKNNSIETLKLDLKSFSKQQITWLYQIIAVKQIVFFNAYVHYLNIHLINFNIAVNLSITIKECTINFQLHKNASKKTLLKYFSRSKQFNELYERCRYNILNFDVIKIKIEKNK